MAIITYKKRALYAACCFALASLSGTASAQATSNQELTRSEPLAGSAAPAGDVQDAIDQVREATEVVKRLEQDAELTKVLQQAQGIFIVPDYGRAALGVGGRGGQGVVLVKQGGEWSNPAFYDFGGVSAGLQAGVEAGSIAMILNNQKAVDSFMQENNWSLNADAGLTVVNWSEKAQAAAGKGDVVVWSDAKGLFGDLAVSVTDIRFDADETAAFYGKQVAQKEIFSGDLEAPPQVAALKQALSAGSGSTASGASGASGSAGSGNDSSAPLAPEAEQPSGASATGSAAEGAGPSGNGSVDSAGGK